jgi:HPt (histidine-containing phosphotransfer) domain-containing protein
MTAHVLPGEKEKCINYGMTDYIAKPIRDNELYELILKYTKDIPATITNENKNGATSEKNNHITNLDYVTELSNGNPAFVNHMIDLFLTENPFEIQRLENAIATKDFHTIQAIAHKIKSNISFAGLDNAIKKELSEIEELASNSKDMQQIVSLFSKVKATCLQAVNELNDFKINQS